MFHTIIISSLKWLHTHKNWKRERKKSCIKKFQYEKHKPFSLFGGRLIIQQPRFTQWFFSFSTYHQHHHSLYAMLLSNNIFFSSSSSSRKNILLFFFSFYYFYFTFVCARASHLFSFCFYFRINNTNIYGEKIWFLWLAWVLFSSFSHSLQLFIFFLYIRFYILYSCEWKYMCVCKNTYTHIFWEVLEWDLLTSFILLINRCFCSPFVADLIMRISRKIFTEYTIFEF